MQADHMETALQLGLFYVLLIIVVSGLVWAESWLHKVESDRNSPKTLAIILLVLLTGVVVVASIVINARILETVRDAFHSRVVLFLALVSPIVCIVLVAGICRILARNSDAV